MIAFQTDKSMEVRKFVIGFIEEAWYVIRHIFHSLTFILATRLEAAASKTMC